jgi:hypothetical protein
MNTRLAIASLLFPLGLLSHGQETVSPVTLELDILIVRMPEATALPLLPALRDASRAAQARDGILKLVTDHKATLIGWPVIRTGSGQRAHVEQTDEVRYATEYDVPGLTRIVETKEPATPDPLNPGPTKVSTSSETISEGIPKSFDTRKTGVTVEAEATLSDDGKTISALIQASHVRLRRFRKSEIEQKGSGKVIAVEQPEFLVNTANTSTTIQAGGTILLGVFKVVEPADHMEFFILHARQDQTKSPPAK